jgi:hypothetical protein
MSASTNHRLFKGSFLDMQLGLDRCERERARHVFLRHRLRG